MKIKLLSIVIVALMLVGCSNTLYADIATLKEINEHSIVIEYWDGKTKEITIPSKYELDENLQVNKDYLFNYEIDRKDQAVLVSVQE